MTDRYEEVRSVVSDVLGLSVQNLTGDSSVETVPEWDSLAQVNIILSLEVAYGLAIDPADAMEMMSVDEILAYLQKSLG